MLIRIHAAMWTWPGHMAKNWARRYVACSAPNCNQNKKNKREHRGDTYCNVDPDLFQMFERKLVDASGNAATLFIPMALANVAMIALSLGLRTPSSVRQPRAAGS